MNDEYTPEDFANARFAEHTDGRIAMRAEPETGIPWYVGDDQIKRLDAAMARDGWRPVREHAPLTLDSAVREMQEKAWDEGYRRGVDDERIAEATQVGIGLGGVATPNRTSPYRRDER